MNYFQVGKRQGKFYLYLSEMDRFLKMGKSVHLVMPEKNIDKAIRVKKYLKEWFDLESSFEESFATDFLTGKKRFTGYEFNRH